MAYSSADLDTIRAVIASGVKSVTFADGRKTEYQTTDAMIAAQRVIQADLTMQARATNGIARRRFATFSPGL